MKTMRQFGLVGLMFTLLERKDDPMKRSQWVLFASTIVLVLCLMGFEGRAEALSVTSLDFTSGAVNWNGHYGGILDQLFAQDGSITMGSYQSMSDIVDPIMRECKTFSLFTSGLNGAPAPSASVNGTSLSVDLSSLFFGWTQGDEVRAWNIGGLATGLINPQTSEFFLSWEHYFPGELVIGKHDTWKEHTATFFLQGTAGMGPTPVPLPASVLFFATGLALMGGLYWRRSRGTLTGTAC